MFYLVLAARHAIEALKQVKRLLIAYHLHIGIILAHQCERTAMVGFHVVCYDIVDGSVANHFADILDKLRKEVGFHRVDEAYFFVNNEVRVVRNAVGKRPQAFEFFFLSVVHTYVIGAFYYFNHIVSL